MFVLGNTLRPHKYQIMKESVQCKGDNQAQGP